VVTSAVVCAEDTVLDTNNDKMGIMTNAVILIVIVLFCYNANFNPWIILINIAFIHTIAESELKAAKEDAIVENAETPIHMVDLVLGRGITDIVREAPFFASIFRKYIGIKLFHSKSAIYGSVDVNNICNLHCSHCYWWLNRKNDAEDLSAEQWREIIRMTFKKQSIYIDFGWR
jgi:sulfatase maturation enzyme AslB (radical SAM superfamily)